MVDSEYKGWPEVGTIRVETKKSGLTSELITRVVEKLQ